MLTTTIAEGVFSGAHEATRVHIASRRCGRGMGGKWLELLNAKHGTGGSHPLESASSVVAHLRTQRAAQAACDARAGLNGSAPWAVQQGRRRSGRRLTSIP